MLATTNIIVGLKAETLDKLRKLRRLNVDSAKGFEECAEMVSDNLIKQAFSKIARSRREHAQVLAAQIEWNDEAESEDGSYLAAMHRSWIKVRDACTSDSLATVLEEAERGEDVIKEAYEDVLAEVVGSPAHGLVAAQYASVKEIHDRVRDLRNQYRDSCN